jgi:predicted ATPase
MTTPPLIRRLTLQNFLSYGPEGVSVDLLPLNVLIGPNGSGKSNLLEALAVLRAAAGDLQGVVREGGGISEYLWKGSGSSRLAALAASVDYPQDHSEGIGYALKISQVGHRLEVADETLKVEIRNPGLGFVRKAVFEFRDGKPIIEARDTKNALYELLWPDLNPSQSVLSQRRDPVHYPEITFLADEFGKFALFQDWNVGRRSVVRLSQPTDLPSDFLLPDASNLGLVLHDIGQISARREELTGYLRRFYASARYVSTKIQGGTIQLFVEEEDGRLIPTTRLSDGTLRYLCLLAILLHPNPPPVIGIEEPELGLHPDIMPTIAELLKKASERTQLFVTTHSDALVSALSDTPESILVCEGTPDGTTMKRLDAERLSTWLKDYSLGEIWRMGEIGGNRW